MEGMRMELKTRRKEPTDEQRRFRLQHEAILQAISERGLTHEEAMEFRRLKAKIAAAEEEHRRRKFLAKSERGR
jgi:hypothetical protein